MFYIAEDTDALVIRVEGFLPHYFINQLFEVAIKFQKKFSIPSWATENGKSVENQKSLCSALDLWFPIGMGARRKPKVPEVIYELIENYLFHQGIMEFCKYTEQEIFRLLPTQCPNGKAHIICYGNKDYYGWHKDHTLPSGPFLYGSSPSRKNLFTFNLNLCLNDNMTGGDLLFLRDNQTHRIPFKHNSLTIMPATVAHAVSEVSISKEEKFTDRRFSFQFWMAGTQLHSLQNISPDKRWK